MQIKALEGSLGTLLFDRTRRSIELTAAGEILLEHARLTVNQLACAVDLTQRAGRGEAGLLRVAFTGSVPLVSTFAALIRAFRREWPLVRLDIMHMATGRQLEALSERRIDVGFLRPSHFFRPPPHLEISVFWKDELRLVLPSSHPLSTRRKKLPVGALRDERFVLFPRETGCGLHDHVIGLCSDAGFVPQVAQEALEGTTIIGLVAAGVGISLLPDSYAKVHTEGVTYAKLDTPNTGSKLYLAHHRDDASPLLQRFVKLARNVGKSNASAALGAVTRNRQASALI